MSKKFISDRVINQGNLPETTYQMVWPSFGPKEYSFTLLEHQRETEEKMLKQAKEKALFIEKEAKEKALLIEKEAYEKGFAQGEKDGLELGQKRIDTVVQQMTHLFQEMQNQREWLYKTFEKEMLQLVLSISKRVLGHEVQMNDGIIVTTLREASKQVVDQRKMTIRVNPSDFQFLNTHADQWSHIERGGQGVQMIKDPSITRGGCVIEMAFGDVDGTIETQFDQVVSLLWERFRESGQGSGPA